MTNSTDRQLRSRLRGAAFLAGGAALLAYAFSACSYDALHSDIQVLVDGLPVSAIRGHVTLTTTNGDSKEYFPRIPPRSTSSIGPPRLDKHGLKNLPLGIGQIHAVDSRSSTRATLLLLLLLAESITFATLYL